jgi:hypothetical protein
MTVTPLSGVDYTAHRSWGLVGNSGGWATSGPGRPLVVGAITTGGAPPFALFERWDSRPQIARRLPRHFLASHLMRKPEPLRRSNAFSPQAHP